MEQVTLTPPANEAGVTDMEKRGAPRVTLLIRAAKLIGNSGEYVCVIRDVSETGMSVRLFHHLPDDQEFELHMPGGQVYEVSTRWTNEFEAGFEFSQPVKVEKLIHEAGEYPKRGLRLDLFFPIKITTLAHKSDAFVENISQQGGRFRSDELYAIDQNLRIAGEGFPEIRAKVRWRRDDVYGVVFDDTFTLGDFARFAAKVQAPDLLEA